MFRLNPNSRRLKNGKHGFSLVELIVVILIIAILAVAVFAGGSAAIKKAQKARAISDLHNFQIAVAMTMNENPQIANIEAATKKDKLSAIMNALNANLPADYKVTLQTDAMTGNISMAAQSNVNADYIICKSEKTDAWDNPYFVIIDSAQRGGSAASEFYMTTLTAGPNAILNLDGSVDKDDLFDLTSYSDGDVISATYDVSDAVPTIVGGTAAATSYTDPAAAPVNNGITTAAVISASPEPPAEPEPDPVSYSITTTVTNGSYTGATSIDENGVATVTISASDGYELPDSVTVTGASKSYISSTGVITLSNPTGNVTIAASCEAVSNTVGIYAEGGFGALLSGASVPQCFYVNGVEINEFDTVQSGCVIGDGGLITTVESGSSVTIRCDLNHPTYGLGQSINGVTIYLKVNGVRVVEKTVDSKNDAFLEYTFTATEDTTVSGNAGGRFVLQW